MIETVWMCVQCDAVLITRNEQETCCDKPMDDTGWFETRKEEPCAE